MIVQPFDFNPVNIVATADTYTVPAGKYAWVMIQVIAKALATRTEQLADISVALGSYNTHCDFQRDSMGFWLKSADVITKAAGGASGSGTITSAGAGEEVMASSKSETNVQALLNGNTILEVTAIANASFYYSASAARTLTYVDYSGSHKLLIMASEYNVIT